LTTRDIDQLVSLLSRLPGLGPRSARRATLHVLKRRETLLQPLIVALQAVDQRIVTCAVCGNLDTVNPCALCTEPGRDDGLICVVEDVADVWALARTHIFRGRFHVLGGHLSALDGIGPDDLRIDQLVARVRQGGIREVVLAMNATLEGQTTAHVVADRLEGLNIEVSRLAHGVPVGGELEYLDDGTLAQALNARTKI
jgi:recombination protein RecR